MVQSKISELRLPFLYGDDPNTTNTENCQCTLSLFLKLIFLILAKPTKVRRT